MKVYTIGKRSMTALDMEAMVRGEGKLGKGTHFNPKTELRCAMGVIGNWGLGEGNECIMLTLASQGQELLLDFAKANHARTMVTLNDQFQGTPEQRCEF